MDDLIREYRRNRQRIQRQIRRLEKRGYLVDDNILPKIPKNITRSSVNRLSKITKEKIYSKAIYLNQETGEIQKGKKSRQFEVKIIKERRAERKLNYPDYNEIIIDNFKEQMRTIFLVNFRGTIFAWLNGVINSYGKQGAAEILEKGAAAGLWPGYEAVSNLDLVTGKLAAMLDLFDNTASLHRREELINELEEDEEWSSLEDAYNPFIND